MKMLGRSFFIICSFFSICFAQQTNLSSEQYAVLNKFFHTLIEESELGFVMQGNKPMCIHGFFNKDPFSVNTIPHRHSVALREGARIWQQLVTSNPDLILTISKKEDPLIPNWIHVIVIHPPLFHSIVKKNLHLFQYILGPAISSESLLSALISDKVTYHTLLKGDKVLIGEILGFGTQNALYISRIENIEEALEEQAPPFLNTVEVVREYSNEYLPFEIGFGFNSLKQELEFLEKKVTFPSKKLTHSSPEFIFGCLKDSGENRKFISELECSQIKIRKFLKSQTFLEDILYKLTGSHYLVSGDVNFSFALDNGKLNQSVAKGIWESLQGYGKEDLSHFISGMEVPDGENYLVNQSTYSARSINDFIEAKNNLIASNRLFALLNKNEDVKSVIPEKIYYKILKHGDSNDLCEGPLVLLDFDMFYSSGHCIAHKSNVVLNLKNTIPGFSLGVKGMRIGETREIFIHPSLGYGFDTSLEKCSTLRAVVTLKDVYVNQLYSRPEKTLNLDFILDENLNNEQTEKNKAALFEKGKQIALHLKKCPQIDLDRVRNYLRNFQDNSEIWKPTTVEEQCLINQMHWNIYFN